MLNLTVLASQCSWAKLICWLSIGKNCETVFTLTLLLSKALKIFQLLKFHLSVCVYHMYHAYCCVHVCVCVCARVRMYPGCLFVWSDQCVIVCPLSLSLLLPVTPEAIGFLSAVGVFIVALAVLFLFINKKLCFSRVGGLPCLEVHGRRKKGRAGIRQGLGEWLTTQWQ